MKRHNSNETVSLKKIIQKDKRKKKETICPLLGVRKSMKTLRTVKMKMEQ